MIISISLLFILTTLGCNAWMAINNFSNGSNSGNVSKDATINTYLNNEYYNCLNVIAKNKVNATNFKVGLLSISEFVRGGINENCKSVNAYFSDSGCYDNSSSHNYLFDIVTSAGLYNGWLITPYKTNPHDSFLVRLRILQVMLKVQLGKLMLFLLK